MLLCLILSLVLGEDLASKIERWKEVWKVIASNFCPDFEIGTRTSFNCI